MVLSELLPPNNMCENFSKNYMDGLDPDTSLFISLVMDSSSVIAIASKARDTHHIQRQVRFVQSKFL